MNPNIPTEAETLVILTITIPVSASAPPTPAQQQALARACGDLAAAHVRPVGPIACEWAGPNARAF